MIVLTVTQGTPEWHQARMGAITASRCKDACDRLKNGAWSQKAIGYAAQIAMERATGESYDDTFVTYAMRRGSELEPEARRAYELETGRVALESGIVLTDDMAFGYSTDGFVGDDGMIEIKCPQSANVVLSLLETGDLDDYMHQIQMGLWITGRKWVDFIMFDPRARSIGKELFLKRVDRDESFIEPMESQLIEFKSGVEEKVSTLLRKAA